MAYEETEVGGKMPPHEHGNDFHNGDLHRLHTHELELGTTDVLKRHLTRHVVHAKPVSQGRLNFEHKRPRWLREMAAEATGVFMYVYPGIASTAAFIFAKAEPGFGSVFQIGWAYAIGIAFAIITSAATSGGHFSPAITICFTIWQGFPLKKVPYYIFAQIFGAFLASCVLYGQYYESFHQMEQLTLKAHKPLVGPSTVSSVLCIFPKPTQGIGYLFLIEFFADTFLGFVIWAVLDPANPFITPAGAPFIVGLAYGVMIWGFAEAPISTNLARDMGTRLAGMMFWGKEVFTFHGYWWIALFVNIPATIVATCWYELCMRDSLDRIGMGHAQHEEGEDGLTRHFTNTGQIAEHHERLASNKH